MLTFDFPYHLVPETDYPDSSVRVSFGRSWIFTAPPDAPDQRTFTLSFTGFKYYVDENGNIDHTTNANINNMAALEDFYQQVRLYDIFIYPHPVYGNVNVRFKDPLKVPKGVKGGDGVLEDFQISLIEVP